MLFVCMAVCAFAAGPVKVGCIGNSITFGLTTEDPATMSYPAQLQKMLDSYAPGKYEVGKFGRSGATLLRKGHRPYNEMEECAAGLQFAPDIAVFHLGINDTDPRDWPYYNTNFVTDYIQLIDSFKAVNPNVRVIIANISPINATHKRFEAGTREWRLKVRNAVKDVAKATGAELIDFETPLLNHRQLMPDGIHPNEEGLGLLAKEVFGAITGEWGGLSMPEVYADGMIVQRDRHFTIKGRADAGSHINVNIDNRNFSAVANNRGDWSVTVPPLLVGAPYTLTVTDGKDTLTFKNILAGEVWVASGQSNMAFTVGETVDAATTLETPADTLLRFFDMKPRASTSNSKEWPEEVLRETRNLNYYLPAHWQSAEKVNPAWSAVAYHFGKMLRDSLQVPVGIISNSIGGAPTESWVDITTLEEGMPGIIAGWPKNHFVQEWVGKRATQNAVDPAVNGHPYKPGYLFATGILPLGNIPVAGVIWYQGESNEQNVEVHEKLFGMLLKSWREYFGDPDMPVHYVQLSSISRPSWPEFRDSQRRMSTSLPNVAMAVSFDHGDSLDVHPRNKKPVGQRLGLTALNRVYGHSNEWSGPTVASAVSDGSSIILTMDHARGLTTSDGGEPITFEIAEIDGVYFPAKATIKDNKIILTNMDVKNPKYARYGWQPFSRANVINSDNLPASTFKVEVDNAADFDIEEGLEVGVSACYAGLIGDKLIMAGGCNFPSEPMAPGSKKKFYKGIYAADVNDPDLGWKRIGSLPEGMAYGASATLPESILLIGGTTADKALSSVLSLAADGSVSEMPALPYTVDNMGACVIGRKVYVAGGNAAGVPSNQLLMLDLDNLNAGWVALKPMPGNPRVQPVVAAAVNPKGEKCVYVWGGFAGKHNGKDATLNTDGLCYIPSKDKWEKMPAPKDALGNEVSLGGGVAVTLSDGTVYATGGVNKDIFLAALQNQAPDYLQHPIEWYRFNPIILNFNPATEKWTIFDTLTDAARAGATAVTGISDDFFIIGGELKPRIRTAEVLRVTK